MAKLLKNQTFLLLLSLSPPPSCNSLKGPHDVNPVSKLILKQSFMSHQPPFRSMADEDLALHRASLSMACREYE